MRILRSKFKIIEKCQLCASGRTSSCPGMIIPLDDTLTRRVAAADASHFEFKWGVSECRILKFFKNFCSDIVSDNSFVSWSVTVLYPPWSLLPILYNGSTPKPSHNLELARDLKSVYYTMEGVTRSSVSLIRNLLLKIGIFPEFYIKKFYI